MYPKVVGKSIGLPSVWVLAAITIGGTLMGITGMLIGVPIFAALYKLLKEDILKRDFEEARALEAKKKKSKEEKNALPKSKDNR